MSADQIAAQIKPLHPKTVVLVFDVTESTQRNGVFSTEREASATIVREGCRNGDHVVLESFGTDFKTVYDRTLASAADIDDFVQSMPAAPESGHGTNIRLPHSAALKLIDRERPHPGVVVLLTDSFNDRPLPTDATYPKYLSYYSLDSLTHYPDTPENKEYSGLLADLLKSGKLHQYGVGIGIADDGRPIERLPVSAAQGDADVAAAPQSTQSKETPQSPLPYIIGIVVVLLIAVAAAVRHISTKPTPVRLRLGDKSLPKDYHLRPNEKVGLGGSLGIASSGEEVFPIAGLAKPVAYVQPAGGGTLSLTPAELPADVRVYYNGVLLESPVSLRAGDEIRISATDPATAIPKDYRVHVVDDHE